MPTGRTIHWLLRMLNTTGSVVTATSVDALIERYFILTLTMMLSAASGTHSIRNLCLQTSSSKTKSKPT